MDAQTTQSTNNKIKKPAGCFLEIEAKAKQKIEDAEVQLQVKMTGLVEKLQK